MASYYGHVNRSGTWRKSIKWKSSSCVSQTKRERTSKKSRRQSIKKANFKFFSILFLHITLYTAPLPPTPRNKGKSPLPLCTHIYITTNRVKSDKPNSLLFAFIYSLSSRLSAIIPSAVLYSPSPQRFADSVISFKTDGQNCENRSMSHCKFNEWNSLTCNRKLFTPSWNFFFLS